jgi:hypothetical protein
MSAKAHKLQTITLGVALRVENMSRMGEAIAFMNELQDARYPSTRHVEATRGGAFSDDGGTVHSIVLRADVLDDERAAAFTREVDRAIEILSARYPDVEVVEG